MVNSKTAAEYLGVTQQYISKLCRDGVFPNAKQVWDAFPWYVPMEDLEAFAKQRRIKKKPNTNPEQ